MGRHQHYRLLLLLLLSPTSARDDGCAINTDHASTVTHAGVWPSYTGTSCRKLFSGSLHLLKKSSTLVDPLRMQLQHFEACRRKWSFWPMIWCGVDKRNWTCVIAWRCAHWQCNCNIIKCVRLWTGWIERIHVSTVIWQLKIIGDVSFTDVEV